MLVVDNDPAASARSACTGFHPAVRYVHEPRPGIAAARSRALREAGEHDVLVFIDDDERPSAGWLRSLLDTFEPDRIGGRGRPGDLQLRRAAGSVDRRPAGSSSGAGCPPGRR